MAQFYSLEQAARVLGMSPDELKAKVQAREVRAMQDAGNWQFRVADIDELARRRGMGSDPDLSLSDLDLEVPQSGASDSGAEIDLSEFQLGVATPDIAAPSAELRSGDQDVPVDDTSVPPELTGSSSTIIGMKPAGKQPSDSDVKLVPEDATPRRQRLRRPPGDPQRHPAQRLRRDARLRRQRRDVRDRRRRPRRHHPRQEPNARLVRRG